MKKNKMPYLKKETVSCGEEQVRCAYPEWYEELQKTEGFYKWPNKKNEDYQLIEGDFKR